MSALRPLSCHACGGQIPLTGQASTQCPYCSAVVSVPAEYAHAVELQARAAQLRRSLEPQWQSLTRPRAGATEWLAAALVLLLPPLASVLAAALSPSPLGPDEVVLLVGIPALLPGGAIWVWAIASRATVLRLGQALAASPPKKAGAAPGCRSCGAPLAVEPGALGATCGYCGTDSMVVGVALTAARSRLRDKLRTFDDALRTLRARRILMGLGAVTLVLLMMGASGLIWLAMRVLF